MTLPAARRRPVIGMALFGDATFDSRVRREAASIGAAGFEVVLVCLGDAGTGTDLPASVRVEVRVPSASTALPGVANPFHEGPRGALARLTRPATWLAGYARNLRAWGRMAVEAAGPVDAWHLHDFPGLAAVGPLVAGRLPVVYDSHEIFMDAGTAGQLPGPGRAVLRRYEGRLVSRVDALVTVNDSLAEVLGRRYHPRRTLVVHNCPARWAPLPGQEDLLRRAAGIPEGTPVVLYHGAIGGGRGIEQLLEALLEPGLERLHAVVMGPGDPFGTYRQLVTDPRWGGRAHLLPAVPPTELLSWVSTADVGGVTIQRTSLNHELATPNKLFECVAAGVPVVVSDYPTMRRIVLDTALGPLGVTCDATSPVAVAAAIRSILDLDPQAAAALRTRCRHAAAERWNWETEAGRLVELYRELIGVDPAHET